MHYILVISFPLRAQGHNKPTYRRDLHIFFKAERQARVLWIPTFKSVLVWFDEEIEPKSPNY